VSSADPSKRPAGGSGPALAGILLLALPLGAAGDGERSSRCEALFQAGRGRYFEGRFAEARESFRAARACAREEGGGEDTLSHRYEGLCFQYEDRLEEAIATFRAAATEVEREERAAGWSPPSPRTAVADAVNNVGWALYLAGEYALARSELDRALVLAPDGPEARQGTVWVHGRIRTNRAVVTAILGDAAGAFAELQAIVSVASADRMNRTRALEHLGRLEESWGDLEAALARHEEALATGEAALKEAAPHPYNRAYLVGVLSRVGLLRERLGRPAAAREALDRALLTARELGTRQLIVEVLVDRGRLAREAGDLDTATASHEEARSLAESARLELPSALALAELGRDRLAGGAAAAALALFEQALRSPAAARAPETTGAIRAGLARAREAQGELARAAEEDDRAVEAIESVRLGELPEARRLGFWRLRQGVFRDAIALRHRLLLASGDSRQAERALELAEQARSRTLLDLVSRGVVPGAPEGGARAWTVGRLRDELLGEDTGLLEFALDEPRSWGFFLTRDACGMAALPGRGEIEAGVRALRRRAASPAPYGPRARAEAAALRETLLSPFAARLAAVRRLVVAGEGALHLLPFEALEDGRGQLLLETHVVSYAPSASVSGALHARHAARPRGGERLLAYADPPSAGLGPLPLARLEAESIARLFPEGEVELRRGRRASESWLRRAPLVEYAGLHFATHGRYDDRAPGRSGLVLAPGEGEDGLLQVREIAALSLRARLVTLSACETGLGEMVTGEGVVGVARAFLDAGADAVAMSLWRIPDASTAELMRRFYLYLRDGRPAADALREAKIELRRSRPARAAPFHWAGVILTGDADSKRPGL
jgi:CHAT domain-containing protein/tetratricopeptide (TPR) repeat protein